MPKTSLLKPAQPSSLEKQIVFNPVTKYRWKQKFWEHKVKLKYCRILYYTKCTIHVSFKAEYYMLVTGDR